jgi:hypothetical protein
MSKRNKDRITASMIALCCFIALGTIAMSFRERPSAAVETLVIVLTTVGCSFAVRATGLLDRIDRAIKDAALDVHWYGKPGEARKARKEETT